MSFKATMAKLKFEYIDSLPEKIAMLEGLLEAGHVTGLETEFHKLKGNGKTYGLPEVSQLGEVMEAMLQKSEISPREDVLIALEILEDVFLTRSQGIQIDLDLDIRFTDLQEQVQEKVA